MPAAPDWSQDEIQLLLGAVRDGHPPSHAPSVTGLRRTPAACERRIQLLRRSGRSIPSQPPRAGPWSDEETDLLIKGYNAADTYAQISVDVGRTTKMVDRRVRELRAEGVDLPPRKPNWTGERRQRLADLKRRGSTLPQLEAEFGLARGSITYQLRVLRELGYDLGVRD